MVNTLEKVREFAKAFCPEQAGGKGWTSPDKKTAILRLQLLTEELGELAHAIAADDNVEILDALTDLQYVLDGTYLAFGLDHLKLPAFLEVHRSNMSKLDKSGKPLLDEAGRVCKSELYSPPDLKKVLEEGEMDERWVVYDKYDHDVQYFSTYEEAFQEYKRIIENCYDEGEDLEGQIQILQMHGKNKWKTDEVKSDYTDEEWEEMGNSLDWDSIGSYILE